MRERQRRRDRLRDRETEWEIMITIRNWWKVSVMKRHANIISDRIDVPLSSYLRYKKGVPSYLWRTFDSLHVDSFSDLTTVYFEQHILHVTNQWALFSSPFGILCLWCQPYICMHQLALSGCCQFHSCCLHFLKPFFVLNLGWVSLAI